MIWAMVQSMSTSVRWLFDILWISMPAWSMLSSGFLRWTSVIGGLMTMVEGLFFSYYSQMWLKRMPNYDHDFLGTWLFVTNFTLASYLGALQFYSRVGAEEGSPKLGYVAKGA